MNEVSFYHLGLPSEEAPTVKIIKRKMNFFILILKFTCELEKFFVVVVFTYVFDPLEGNKPLNKRLK